MSTRSPQSGFRSFIAVAAGVIGAAVLAIGLTIWWLRSNAIEDAYRDNSNLAAVLSGQISNSVHSIDLVLDEIRTALEARARAAPGDFDRILRDESTHQYIVERLSHLPQAMVIGLVDRNGKLANSTQRWPTPTIEVSDTAHFRHFAHTDDHGVYITNSQIDRIGKAKVIFFTRRIDGADNTFLGEAVVGVKLTYFQHIYESIASLQGLSVLFLHRDGTIIVSYPNEMNRMYEKMPAESPWHRLVLQGGGQYRSPGYFDHQPRLVAVQPLADYPLVVDVALSEGAALATWRFQALILGGGTLLVLLCAGFLLRALSRQFRLLATSEAALLRKSRELEQAHATVDAALNNMSQGLVMFDAAGRIIVANDRYRQLYNLPADLVKPGCAALDLLKSRAANGTYFGDPEDYVRKLLAAIAEGKMSTLEVATGDGRIVTVVNQPMAGGGWVATHEDITEAKRAADELRRTHAFLDTVIENVPIPIFVKDAGDRRHTLANRAAEMFYGAGRGEIIGKTLYDMFSKEQADSITAHDDEALQSDQPVIVDHRSVRTPHNGVRVVTSKKAPIRDDSGKPRYLLGVIEDVTERTLAEERIAHLAHYDVLTGLSNRVLFYEQLERALEGVRRGGRLAFLFLDVDHLKRINDTLGHSVGDKLLKGVAERLRGCIKDGDVVARLSGDEFAIIQTSLDRRSDAADLALRVRQAIHEPFDLDGHRVVVDVSVGISLAPEDATERGELLKAADIALYEAKNGGRGTYCFFEREMHERMLARDASERDLQSALANGELELFYQPIVDLEADEIESFEALLRWRHPTRGLVCPGEFIGVAEKTGLIVALGEWALRQACTEAANWPGDIGVAVNVSSVQLMDKNLASAVIGAIAAAGIKPHRLILEITESAFLENTFANLATLKSLHELGVRFSMDDFGTGYSALSYLLNFPFSKIKIDRSFIADLTDKKESRAIVRAITDLGRSLKMRVVAEGVETMPQLEQLRKLGCGEIQGYLFSPPRPAAELREYFMGSGGEKVRIIRRVA